MFARGLISCVCFIRLKPFSIRTLLDLCQQCLVEYGFDDPWRDVKQAENAAALEQLRQRLDELDGLDEGADKWTELLRGVFAGIWFYLTILLISDNQFLSQATCSIREPKLYRSCAQKTAHLGWQRL